MWYHKMVHDASVQEEGLNLVCSNIQGKTRNLQSGFKMKTNTLGANPTCIAALVGIGIC